jgi:hypothetical protein
MALSALLPTRVTAGYIKGGVNVVMHTNPGRAIGRPLIDAIVDLLLTGRTSRPRGLG